MAKYSGLLSSTASDNIDFSEVEDLLGFESESLLDITFEADVFVSGAFEEQTQYQPAEYPEIDDVNIIAIYFNFKSGEIAATQEQLILMEKFKPEDSELFWNLVSEDYYYDK